MDKPVRRGPGKKSGPPERIQVVIDWNGRAVTYEFLGVVRRAKGKPVFRVDGIYLIGDGAAAPEYSGKRARRQVIKLVGVELRAMMRRRDPPVKVAPFTEGFLEE